MEKGLGRAITYIFVLSLVLILLAYYAGVQTDAQAFTNAFGSLLQTTTGRGANNQFASYPTGFVPAG